jgi:hypothetical protein
VEEVDEEVLVVVVVGVVPLSGIDVVEVEEVKPPEELDVLEVVVFFFVDEVVVDWVVAVVEDVEDVFLVPLSGIDEVIACNFSRKDI